jgi:hypothetical protein
MRYCILESVGGGVAKSNLGFCPWSIFEINLIIFFRFLLVFRFSKISSLTQRCCETYTRNLFKMFILVLIDGFLVGFSKFGFFLFKNRDKAGPLKVMCEYFSMRWMNQ